MFSYMWTALGVGGLVAGLVMEIAPSSTGGVPLEYVIASHGAILAGMAWLVRDRTRLIAAYERAEQRLEQLHDEDRKSREKLLEYAQQNLGEGVD